MKLGTTIAIGIGLGAAFGPSMGAAGWALGLGTAMLLNRTRFGYAIALSIFLAGVFTLLAALPLGVLADRFNRVRLSIAAAILWGADSRPGMPDDHAR